MNITTLTNSSLINLQTTYADRDTAIKALAEQLDQQGKLHNKEQYLKAVFAREAHGATALGEGLAVPHGKSDAVKEAGFAVATLKETVKWQGIDEDEMEDVNLIFLLAIPNAEAGSTHMQILTDLTSALVDDDVREAALKATTAEELIALLNGEETKEKEPPKKLALESNQLSFKTELKRALLTGISFAVPLIVAGGTVLAVAVLIAQIFGLQELYGTEDSWLWMFRQLGGGLLGTLMVPVLAAYTAYAIEDKPALGPGFAAGLAANMIGSGFIGAAVGGIVAGYVMRWVRNNIRLQPAFNGFANFYLYPVIGTLVVGILMMFVIGKPVAALNHCLTDWLNTLSGGNSLLLGAILGCFVSFDLGGPVNKAAYTFCLGAMANGIYGPYAIFTSVKMVSAFTVTFSTIIAPRLFHEFEIELGKSTWLLGLAGITEGAIPMAIEDPIRVIGSFLVGSIATGAIVGAAGIGLSTPGAAIVSIFLLDNAGLGAFAAGGIWFGAAIIGTIISTLTLIIWRGHHKRKERLQKAVPAQAI